MGPVLGHWPDAIVCHFQAATPVDLATGVATGKGPLKPYTLIARLTLAPARDGLYWYGVGTIANNDDPPPPNQRDGLKPGGVLAFHPDGAPAAGGGADCAGKSIQQLTAEGLAER